MLGGDVLEIASPSEGVSAGTKSARPCCTHVEARVIPAIGRQFSQEGTKLLFLVTDNQDCVNEVCMLGVLAFEPTKHIVICTFLPLLVCTNFHSKEFIEEVVCGFGTVRVKVSPFNALGSTSFASPNVVRYASRPFMMLSNCVRTDARFKGDAIPLAGDHGFLVD